MAHIHYGKTGILQIRKQAQLLRAQQMCKPAQHFQAGLILLKAHLLTQPAAPKGSPRVAIDIVPHSTGTYVLFGDGTIKNPGTPANAPLSSGGPWTRDAATGYIYPTTLSDKVGIGTTDTQGVQIKLYNNSTVGTHMKLENADAGGRVWNILSSGTANSGGAGNFHIYDELAPVTRLFIQGGTGNVGIGTENTGNNRLRVNGSVWIDGNGDTTGGIGIGGDPLNPTNGSKISTMPRDKTP